jgi:hypothetical protein
MLLSAERTVQRANARTIQMPENPDQNRWSTALDGGVVIALRQLGLSAQVGMLQHQKRPPPQHPRTLQQAGEFSHLILRLPTDALISAENLSFWGP